MEIKIFKEPLLFLNQETVTVYLAYSKEYIPIIILFYDK